MFHTRFIHGGWRSVTGLWPVMPVPVRGSEDSVSGLQTPDRPAEHCSLIICGTDSKSEVFSLKRARAVETQFQIQIQFHS